MTQDHGTSPLRDDRPGGLRPEPAAQSQPEALTPSAAFLRQLAAAFDLIECEHVGWDDAVSASLHADAFRALADERDTQP